MNHSGTSLSGLTLLTFGLVAAGCAPSGNEGRTPHSGVDSTPDTLHEGSPETLREAPDTIADSTDDSAQAPRPPVAARPVYLPVPSGPYRVRVVDENHHDLPRFVSEGRTYVLGTVGTRYAIVVANPTSRRVEAVVSVDGLDAMDGHPANFVEKRGYILPAYGDTTIDGFRTSLDDVATFRFSSVADSYAGRLGQARDVGVIGVAFFPEQAPVPVSPPPPPVYAPRYRSSEAAPASPSPYAEDMSREASSGLGGAGQGGAMGAPNSAGRDAPKKSDVRRPGLGTEFGETRESRVETTAFERADQAHPAQVVAIRYNDRAGLVALGIAIQPPYAAAERDLRLRESADPFRANRFAQPPR
jgi:hypothetical protein